MAPEVIWRREQQPCQGAADRLGDLARHPMTSGKLEGINNKIKTLTKRSDGFHDENFFIRKLLSLHRSKYKLLG
jgi:hypothetical protein